MRILLGVHLRDGLPHKFGKRALCAGHGLVMQRLHCALLWPLLRLRQIPCTPKITINTQHTLGADRTHVRFEAVLVSMDQ